ncbi:MAG TPA: PadR family transcriptional regulator [Kofleriaceae bacterium]|nr:PadR family transcriptional regulator [Kofleriaceae bacterium]
MSSTTRLLVLGVVRIFQPVHGYEVRRELVSWRAQEWASVKPGSIYNALKSLTREGYLEVVGTGQVGGRPERTTYRLTTAGDEEFRTLLREEWWTVRPPIDPLMAAISFIGFVTRTEAIAALEHRTTQIRGMVRHMEFGIDAHDGVDSPYHVREMMRLMNARIASEIGWAEQFIARLRNGEYATADDLPWQPSRTRAGTAARGGKPRAARTARTPARPERDRDRRATGEPARRGPQRRSRALRARGPRR